MGSRGPHPSFLASKWALGPEAEAGVRAEGQPAWPGSRNNLRFPYMSQSRPEVSFEAPSN